MLKRFKKAGAPILPQPEPLPSDFDEAFYLTAYADVRTAVESGQIASGAAHFQQFGRAEGRQPKRILTEETVGDPEPTYGYDCLPLPTPDLMFLVTNGRDASVFLDGGAADLGRIRKAVQEAGVRLPVDGMTVLDWGCGCGRVARHWASEASNVDLFGCDIGGSLIEWCQANLNFGTFSVSPFAPPTAYPDEFFDLIYGISVVTHLTFDEHYRWMYELHRLLKPNGVAVLTAHGPTMIPIMLNGAKSVLDSGQGAIRTTLIDEDAFICLEQATGSNATGNALTGKMFGKIFSSFDILLHRPRYGLMGIHDTYVLRRKSDKTLVFHDTLSIIDIGRAIETCSVDIDLTGQSEFAVLASVYHLYFPAHIRLSLTSADGSEDLGSSGEVILPDKVNWTSLDRAHSLISIHNIPYHHGTAKLKIDFEAHEIRAPAQLKLTKAMLF